MTRRVLEFFDPKMPLTWFLGAWLLLVTVFGGWATVVLVVGDSFAEACIAAGGDYRYTNAESDIGNAHASSNPKESTIESCELP